MKKIPTIILLAGLMALHTASLAQTVQVSEVNYYPSEIGDNTIIRADHARPGGTVIYYTDNADQNYFLYQMTTTAGASTTYKFNWPNHANINSEKFIVNDMELGKDWCFFCGAHITINGNVTDTVGMVGCIDMNNIFTTPSSITFDYCEIPNTTEFTQLDLSDVTANYRLCLAGRHRLTNVYPCVAFAEWQGQWVYNMIRILSPFETLTDIAFSKDGNKVVTVSRLLNEPFKFILRCDMASNLFIFPPTPPPSAPYLIEYGVVFNTSGLTLASSSCTNPTWHGNNIVARIIGHNNPNYFTVAYECVDNTKICETQQQVAMFKIDASTAPTSFSMSVVGQQVVHGYFDESQTFVDMRYYQDVQEHFFLLHRSEVSPKKSSVISFPSWGTYGQRPALLADQEVYQSIDWRYTQTSTHLIAGGKRSFDSRITTFSQDIAHLDVSCHMTKPYTFTEELLGAVSYDIDHHSVSTPARATVLNPNNSPKINNPVQQNSCVSFYIP